MRKHAFHRISQLFQAGDTTWRKYRLLQSSSKTNNIYLIQLICLLIMNGYDLDLDLLRAFVAVAETGSFTSAAEVIGRTQSAVSQKVARLEETLQMRVFERTSRSLRLTRDGERVLTAGRRLLGQYDAFMQDLRKPPAVRSLRLGVSENLIQTQLPRLLSRFSELFPDIQLELTTSSSQSLLDAYEAKQLDIVIARTCQDMPSQRGRVIWREPLAWMAGPEFRNDPKLPARLVMMPSPCVFRDIMISSLESSRHEWTTGCTVSNLSGVRAAVLGGLGVTVLNKSFARDGMTIIPASKDWPALPSVEISIVGDTPAMQHIVQPLVDLLTQELADGGV
jgi:DNA-binding transcriptional LysR family regulator